MKSLITVSCICLCHLCISQNVGIGTNTPQEKLDVNGALRIGTTAANNPGAIRYQNSQFEGNVNGFYWTPMQIPINTVIKVTAIGNLLNEGFTLFGSEENLIRGISGYYPGTWNSGNFPTGGGYYFGGAKSNAIFHAGKMMTYVASYVRMIDPATHVWTQSSLNTVATYGGAYGASSVWTGTEMIIYGGYSGGTDYKEGVKYNPTTNTWTAIAASPVKRMNHSAVWTGSEMIVFGGDSISTSTGGPLCTGPGFPSNKVYKYNPTSNTWTGPVTTSGTAPSARRSHNAVWTGTKMLVFGGTVTATGMCNGEEVLLNDCFSFDPATNTWSSEPADMLFTSSIGVWTGTKLLIWGAQYLNSILYVYGRMFDPVTHSWTGFPDQGYLLDPTNTGAVWTGSVFYITDGFRDQEFNPSAGNSYAFSAPYNQKYFLLRKL